MLAFVNLIIEKKNRPLSYSSEIYYYEIVIMKKIFLDCDLMKNRNSGLYYYCLNLGLQVKKILDSERAEEIRFYGKPDELAAFDNSDAIAEEKLWLRDKRKFGLAEKRWYDKYFKKKISDNVIWHAPFQSGRILPGKNAHAKILLTIHDLNTLHEDKFTDEQRASSLAHTQKLIDMSHALVCISEYCRQDVLTNLDVKGKPVYVIHNGTNNMAKPGIVPEGYHPQRPFLFSLGYVNRKKNFHTLIPLLVTEPELELVIAGKIDETDYLEQMNREALALGVSDRLHVLGPVSEGDKAWYYSNCFAFMFPSVAEGFGLPVTEAMAFGKPLFLSPLTSLPEIGGDTAFYFPTFQPEAVQQLFKQGMERYETEKLAEKIKARGQTFNWEKSARAYIDVYRSLF